MPTDWARQSHRSRELGLVGNDPGTDVRGRVPAIVVAHDVIPGRFLLSAWAVTLRLLTVRPTVTVLAWDMSCGGPSLNGGAELDYR
ncbi:hypothetical protein ACQP2F_14990 [Actinoplanes sp. CA-030573]|uniref:hypothetical protein n=1 Tax=Actinoplanes sp. CA-030573 TaxID=3239898 RepID=UPI003D8F715C